MTQEESCNLKEPAWVYSRADHNEQISFICIKKLKDIFKILKLSPQKSTEMPSSNNSVLNPHATSSQKLSQTTHLKSFLPAFSVLFSFTLFNFYVAFI